MSHWARPFNMLQQTRYRVRNGLSLASLIAMLCFIATPTPVSAVTPMVAAGLDHTVALKSDGTVVAWGNNSSGQIGDGTTTNHFSPVAVPGLTGVVAVAAGLGYTVALKSDGTVVVWGDNSFGQLGDGTTTHRLNPVPVPGLTGVVAVAAGAFHTVALKSDGTVVVWGDNSFGQLGDGTTTNRLSPVPVPGLTDLVAVSAGHTHTVGLRTDGTIVAWGSNSYGQLGDGTTTNRSSPGAVPGLTGMFAVAAGASYSVAIKSDGTVVAWGSNPYGQLGDGTTTDRLSPVPVPGLAGIVAVSARAQTVAIQSDGTVVAWGNNSTGQLGDGTTTNHFSPVAVPGLTGAVAVAAGVGYTAALKSDGTVVAWGDNTSGNLGDGTTIDRLSQITVSGGLNLHDTVALNLVPGWNLVGNGVSNALDVAALFGDANQVNTVWKWLPAASSWAFYTPSLADGGAAYAASKGYATLTSVGSREGLWVNAKAGFTVPLLADLTPLSAPTLPGTVTVAGTSVLSLRVGWNMIAIDTNATPSAFNQEVIQMSYLQSILHPGAPPISMTTLWAWNAAQSNWYFYAPSLDASGTLVSYIASKSYLDFGAKVLDPTTGFWVNIVLTQ